MKTQEIVDDILHHQPIMENARAPWEPAWREIDERVNPLGEGGFDGRSKGNIRGLDIFDHTASLGLDRFVAAVTGMDIPRGEKYHTLSTTSGPLNDVPAVIEWLEHANDRIFAARYAPHAGFSTEASTNISSLGTYGNGPFWTDHLPGRGLFYKTHHMSEIYVDENAQGRIDTVHRKFTLTVRKALQMPGWSPEILTPLLAKAFDEKKWDKEFTFLHVVRPRGDRDPDRLDYRRMRFESRYICLEDKQQVREGGYNSSPMQFSRYSSGPRERYGRSPALKVLGTIRTVNEMERTILRAGHKAVDPPLLTPEDGALSQIQTMPGGINVGGLDFAGNPTVVPMAHGGNLQIGMELLNNEREPIRDAFLEKVWSLVLERKDRMTATEVLEITRMQGMLLAPMASRQETEWHGPRIERELEILEGVGYIRPRPPEMLEEGAAVKAIYDNPLSRAAKAEEALGVGRWLEMLAPAAAVDPSVYDAVNTETLPRELGKSLAVRQVYMNSPEVIAEKRKAREEREAVESALGQLKVAGDAVKGLSSARGEESALVA